MSNTNRNRPGAPLKVPNGVRRGVLLPQESWDEAKHWQVTLKLATQADGLRAMLDAVLRRDVTFEGIPPKVKHAPTPDLDDGRERVASQEQSTAPGES